MSELRMADVKKALEEYEADAWGPTTAETLAEAARRWLLIEGEYWETTGKYQEEA